MKAISFLLTILLTINDLVAQITYHPKEMTIQTRWAKDVGPENTHSYYPRPQLVRSNWSSLNGLWDYKITDANSSIFSGRDGKILVPYPIESALSGVKKQLLPDQLLWYRRSFKKPQMRPGEKLILHFGAVDFDATVFVNGSEAGRHRGGYTSFSLDVTHLLKSNNNELTVKVWDPTDQGYGPHGKQTLSPDNIFYTASSGIWQTVWMEVVPNDYVEKLTITPDIDKSAVYVVVHSKANMGVEITADGKTVNGNSNTLITIPVTGAHLWTPNDPFLYDISIRMGDDLLKSYFGMRKISIAKDNMGVDRIMLNNAYLYNLGTLDQGFWPDGLYTAPTDEALRFDIEAIKAMGFNTIRKHIKVEPARWYYYADKLGIMVWQDMVNPNPNLPQGAMLEFETECKEILDQLYNSPCVTTWVLFNERWGRYDQERLTKWMKKKDSTRLVNGHSGELLYVNDNLREPASEPYIGSDMSDVHSYPYPKNSLKITGKAQVCGEFGGLGVSVIDHQWNELNGWGYAQIKPSEFKKKYKEMIDSLIKFERRGLSGSIYTQPFDVESEENGLMSYDRKVIKMPVEELRNLHSRLIFQPKLKGYKLSAEVMSIENPLDRYLRSKMDYQAKKNDSSFVRRISIDALREKDVSMLCKAYTQFTTITNNRNDPKNLILSDAVDKFVSNLIEVEFRDQILRATSETKLDSIENKIAKKYGILGERMFLETKALHYYVKFGKTKEINDLNSWVEIKRQMFNKTPKWTGIFSLNNDAWYLFQRSSFPDHLTEALKWSEWVVKNEPTANYYDTYANILYKLGKKSEAMAIMEKAIQLPSGNGTLEDVKANLEKMRANKATWDTNKELR